MDIKLGRFELSSLHIGDAIDLLSELPPKSIHSVITSPPYWNLRDYGVEGQIGLEQTITEYIVKMVEVFREVHRVLRDDGTLWINMGDTYAMNGRRGDISSRFNERYFGHSKPGKQAETPRVKEISYASKTGLQPKNLCGIPWRVAFALQIDGWILRSDIIWSKTSPMPESVIDRPVSAHEHIFLFAKFQRYFYDGEAIREVNTGRSPMPYDTNVETYSDTREGFKQARFKTHHREYNPAGHNARNVWTISTEAVSEKHYATFPQELVRRCLLASTSQHGVCSECGAPWVRVIEEVPSPSQSDEYKGKHRESDPQAASRSLLASVKQARDAGRPHDNPFPRKKTVAWASTCEHSNSEVIPAAVLDPFMGSGTVAMVAERFGRRWLGFDLDPRNSDIMQRRLKDLQLDLFG